MSATPEPAPGPEDWGQEVVATLEALAAAVAGLEDPTLEQLVAIMADLEEAKRTLGVLLDDVIRLALPLVDGRWTPTTFGRLERTRRSSKTTWDDKAAVGWVVDQLGYDGALARVVCQVLQVAKVDYWLVGELEALGATRETIADLRDVRPGELTLKLHRS